MRHFARIAAVLVATLFLSVPAVARALPPVTTPQTILYEGFESAHRSYVSTIGAGLETTSGAMWGPITQVHRGTGGHGLWCAGKVTASATADAWVYYQPSHFYPVDLLTVVTFDLTRTVDLYSSSVEAWYTMPSKGVNDKFLAYSVTVGMNDSREPGVSAGWAPIRWSLSATSSPALMSRRRGRVEFQMMDNPNDTPSTGQGPTLDDVTVRGFTYGPVRSLAATISAGHVVLRWKTPWRSTDATAVEERPVAYRVWRTPDTNPAVWTEVTPSRIATTTFTDSTAPDGYLRYAVQAWQPGTGVGYGEVDLAGVRTLHGVAPPVAITRVTGIDRYEVAYNLAKMSFPNWKARTGAAVGTVIIACGSDRAAADPLGAAGLSGAANAPILLVRNDTVVKVPSITTQALQEIAAVRGGKPAIIVVGGTASVTLAHWNALRPYASSMTRIAGIDRYAVAAGVAAEIKRRRGVPPFVLIAAGQSPARFYDPLALGAIASANRVPVLLMKGSIVPPSTLAALPTLGASKDRYLGAHLSVVSEAARLTLGVPAANRISGADVSRESFAAEVARFAVAKGWLGLGRVGVVNKVADALGGGAAMGFANGPVLYTNDLGGLPPATSAFLAARTSQISTVTAIGGPASVPTATLDAIRALWP